MDLRIASVLRCPASGAPLELLVIESEVREGRDSVRTGILYCHDSRHWYPIINHVPVLLTFRTPLADSFRAAHSASFSGLAGYTPPNLPPMPGEKSIQKTFTEEWIGLGNDDRTFLYSDSELIALHRDVWLRFEPAEAAVVDSVLNVGCGFGKEAIILGKIFPCAD